MRKAYVLSLTPHFDYLLGRSIKVSVKTILAVATVVIMASCSGRSQQTPIVTDYRSPGQQPHVTPYSLCIRNSNHGWICGSGSTGGSPCDISSQTADPPAPQNRTTIGVGEQVTITASGMGLFVSGDGTLNGNILTAGQQSGSVTVTTKGRGKVCTENSIYFQVEAPTNNYYVTYDVVHDYGFQDVGIRTNVYLQPDGVSFQAVSYKELEIGAQTPGLAWACLSGHGHSPNPNWIQAGVNVPGLGAPIGNDKALSGSCGGPFNHSPYRSGSEIFNIPDHYLVGGAEYPYSLTVQQATADTAGDLVMQKANATGSTTVTSASSN